MFFNFIYYKIYIIIYKISILFFSRFILYIICKNIYYSGISDYLVNLLLSLNNINADMNIIQLIQLEILGYSLYTYYAVLLIILGFVLLLGMFSAIILSKKDE